MKDSLTCIQEYPSLINCNDDEGWNCLINASKKGHLALVNRLLEAGASCEPSLKHSALR